MHRPVRSYLLAFQLCHLKQLMLAHSRCISIMFVGAFERQTRMLVRVLGIATIGTFRRDVSHGEADSAAKGVDSADTLLVVIEPLSRRCTWGTTGCATPSI
jgi:hypothetical protein